VRTTWPTKSADNRWNRSRGARDLLQHLSQFPGETWQERWEASGFNQGGNPVSVLRSAPRERSQIGTGAACLLCLRIIQPSLEAFRSNTFLYYGQRFLAAQNDPLLEKFWADTQATPVNPIHHGTALFDIAVAITTQGIALADLTPEAFLHYAWECRRQGQLLNGVASVPRFASLNGAHQKSTTVRNASRSSWLVTSNAAIRAAAKCCSFLPLQQMARSAPPAPAR